MNAVTDYGRFSLSALGCTPQNISDISRFADIPIAQLCEGGDLLVFPDRIDHYGEEIGKMSICHLTDTELRTGDVMGFVGCNDTSLSIRSRFASEGNADNFLHYMLSEVFEVNLLDLKHSVTGDNALELFIYLFPYHLRQAMSQGMFKQYRTHRYNDPKVRGAIDIPRHIRQNLPFVGNIAYRTREFTFDNDVTQLIRHTIEFIKRHPAGKPILNHPETRACVSAICQATPSYSVAARGSVINKNLTPLVHPYFTRYRTLQQLCLKILQHKGLKYGVGTDKVYGLLFSGSWLWEEYVGRLIRTAYRHYYRHKGPRFNLFEAPHHQQIVPDYVRWAPDGVTPLAVADAKYIPLDRATSYWEERATAIYYKTITYMYHLGVDTAYLIYPSGANTTPETLRIRNTSSQIVKLPLHIPTANTFADFIALMRRSEATLLSHLG